MNFEFFSFLGYFLDDFCTRKEGFQNFDAPARAASAQEKRVFVTFWCDFFMNFAFFVAFWVDFFMIFCIFACWRSQSSDVLLELPGHWTSSHSLHGLR